MKKLFVTIGGIALFGLGFASSHFLNQESLSSHVIETDKVTVKYVDVENGDFDVLVTPKKGYNIKPENTLSDDKFYKDGYLVGTTKESAKKHVKNMNELFENNDWQFSWNN